jgi:hypothetical protein
MGRGTKAANEGQLCCKTPNSCPHIWLGVLYIAIYNTTTEPKLGGRGFRVLLDVLRFQGIKVFISKENHVSKKVSKRKGEGWRKDYITLASRLSLLWVIKTNDEP